MKLSTRLLVVFIGIILLFSGAIQAFGQEWSAEQKEVWKMEVAYWDYFKESNAKDFMTLWHKDFIGWPNWASKPGGKDIIEKWAESPFFKILSYDLKPMAINLFGNFGFVYYRVSGVGGDNNNFSGRIGHLWIKQDGKWQIMGGYSGGSTMDGK